MKQRKMEETSECPSSGQEGTRECIPYRIRGLWGSTRGRWGAWGIGSRHRRAWWNPCQASPAACRSLAYASRRKWRKRDHCCSSSASEASLFVLTPTDRMVIRRKYGESTNPKKSGDNGILDLEFWVWGAVCCFIIPDLEGRSITSVTLQF